MDQSRVEPTIFFIEKISFSLKLFSGHFYGQSFIKTVRGPLLQVNFFLEVAGLKLTLWETRKTRFFTTSSIYTYAFAMFLTIVICPVSIYNLILVYGKQT